MPRPWVSVERPGDTDGLSVDLASLTDVETAATRPDNGKKAILLAIEVSKVYRIEVSKVHREWLTVKPAPVLPPLPPNPAHAVIPELNSIDGQDPEYEIRMQEWAIKLRDGSRIVYPPLD